MQALSKERDHTLADRRRRWSASHRRVGTLVRIRTSEKSLSFPPAEAVGTPNTHEFTSRAVLQGIVDEVG